MLHFIFLVFSPPSSTKRKKINKNMNSLIKNYKSFKSYLLKQFQYTKTFALYNVIKFVQM